VLENLKTSESYPDLDYYFDASLGNPYHGLIVVCDDKFTMRQLSSELALSAEYYQYDQDLPI